MQTAVESRQTRLGAFDRIIREGLRTGGGTWDWCSRFEAIGIDPATARRASTALELVRETLGRVRTEASSIEVAICAGVASGGRRDVHQGHHAVEELRGKGGDLGGMYNRAAGGLRELADVASKL